MKLRFVMLASMVLTTGLFVTILCTDKAAAQRGLYKGWLAPPVYRTNEQRRFSVGGGLPTNREQKVKRMTP